MKIFVTVGTTKFDSLIRYIDTKSEFNNMNIEFQVSNGKYVPVNHKYYKFMDQSAIETKYKEADIIITHVGAGTIYKLLELGKKFIVVPNLERIDKHQRDIADYISREKYAFVAYNFNQLSIFIF